MTRWMDRHKHMPPSDAVWGSIYRKEVKKASSNAKAQSFIVNHEHTMTFFALHRSLQQRRHHCTVWRHPTRCCWAQVYSTRCVTVSFPINLSKLSKQNISQIKDWTQKVDDPLSSTGTHTHASLIIEILLTSHWPNVFLGPGFVLPWWLTSFLGHS